MNKVHLTLIVDRSGSMHDLAVEATGSINTMINEQAKSNAQNVTVSLFEFDDEFKNVFGPVQVQEAPLYDLQPRGMTALNDSMARAIRETSDAIDQLPDNQKPDQVIVAVVTDGMENASQEHTLDDVKSLVKEKTDAGWEFAFIASNIDAFAVGSAYHIGNTMSVSHSAQGYGQGYDNLSRSLSSVAAGTNTFAGAWSGSNTTDDTNTD